jgi:hypothetical protein
MKAYTRNLPAAMPGYKKINNIPIPASMEPSPIKRICPSDISVTRRKVSRHKPGATNGNTPSITSISANAVSSVLTTTVPIVQPARYFCGLLFLKYLKNSELGSSTSTSLLFLKLWR